ncbi:hypothetical protein [Moorena producens]|uniref:hypothetical protein n=1 Tax=Moorena producens TaxID=1155739 RepID=UPI003C795C72
MRYRLLGFREQGTADLGTGNGEQVKNPVYLIVMKNAVSPIGMIKANQIDGLV